MPVAAANGLDLFYEEFGSRSDPTLMFVCGLGAQCTRYDSGLVEGFVDRGFHVLRYDNRDAGLSTHMPLDAMYTLSDMAADGIGLLDALGIESVHVWGSSMGGMIAQAMAIEHPTRIATLTSVMSHTGEIDHGAPEPDLLAGLIESTRPSASFDEAVEAAVRLAKAIGSPAHWDEDAQRARQRAFLERDHDPAGTGRQLTAVVTSGSRAEGLRALDVPTLVIHGTVDRLVTPSGGRRTAELVPGARLVEVEGMGHDLVEPFWDTYLAATTDLVHSAGR